jgi:hypothetical protein
MGPTVLAASRRLCGQTGLLRLFLTVKALTVNADTPAPTAAGDEPWRATGLEAPVFADPSGRRALMMSGIGLAMAATTLAALAIVVTAAIGFARLPGSLPLPTPHVLSARTPSALHRIDHHRFVAVVHVRPGRRDRVSDAVADRRAHA